MSASRLPVVAAAGLIVLCVVAAYWNSFAGEFIYDDIGAISENPTIQRLWPIWPVFTPPRSGETVSGRPFLNLSLAINYALGGLEVWGYHATNLAIHIAAALLLFGILRRTFLLPNLRDRFGGAATALALACAAIWAVHPLQTESVTYIIQRAESLVGCFYLLTLYCVIRGARSAGVPPAQALACVPPPQEDAGGTPALPGSPWLSSPRAWPWYMAAVVACLSGMATKEVMVTAPLVVLLYDRTLLAGSFAEALRRRWGLYVALAATWGLLAYLVFATGLIHHQPEMGAPDFWSYARTQPGVILHYLCLSIWPSPLCLDYEWPIANTFWEIFPSAVVVGLSLGATLWGLIRGKVWSFLGAWFFLILAPTSSVFALGEVAYEHRMYLPLAAVVVLVATGGYALWERLLPRLAHGLSQLSKDRPNNNFRMSKGTVPFSLGRKLGQSPFSPATVVGWAAPLAAWAAVLLALGSATRVRNWDYQTPLTIWQATVDTHPSSSFAHNCLGMALGAAGRTDEAIGQYEQSLRLKPNYVNAHTNLGIALAVTGKFNEAIAHFHQALRVSPDEVETHNNLGSALLSLGKTEEAIEHYQRALQLRPDFAEAHNDLASALAGLGRTEEALKHYQQALRLKPDYADAHKYLAKLLLSLGKTEEAIGHYRQALRLKGKDAGLHNGLGNALFAAGKIGQAIGEYQEALRLKSNFAEAHNNLGFTLAAVGRTDEAIEHCRQAVQMKPDDAAAHYNFGSILATVGRLEEAIEHLEQAVRLKPDFAAARANLARAIQSRRELDRAGRPDRQSPRSAVQSNP